MTEKAVPDSERVYRNWVAPGHLVDFRVTVKETDLSVHATCDLTDLTKQLVLQQRGYLESFIRQSPAFARSLQPLPDCSPAPPIVRAMLAAGNAARVGPMAAVAGATAEFVGRGLVAHPQGSAEIIVENGGDIFLHTAEDLAVGVYAGTSPLSMQIGLKINAGRQPMAVCTSSGTIGHSLSLGKADAVCVLSRSCALADAAATSIGNRMQSKTDINNAIEFGRQIVGVDGIVVVAGDELGAWGEVEIVPLKGKKG